MQSKFNTDVQTKIKECGLMKWEVAEAIGITDSTFSKWLRRELSTEQKDRIFAAIEQIVAEREGAHA